VALKGRRSGLRRQARHGDAPEALELSLRYRPPLDWSALLAFLARRTVAGVEHVEDDVYLRTLRVEQDGAAHSGWVAVGLARHDSAVRIALSPSLSRAIPLVLARASRAFDLSCDPGQVAAALGALGARNPGLRLPGAFDGFEAAVRGILGQQVTVKSAHTLAGRFAAAFGEPVATPHPALRFAFPAPHRIAAVEPPQIAALGVVRQRHRQHRARDRTRPAAAGADRGRGRDARGAARDPRHRRVDRAVHRDARARLARRLSAQRLRRAQGAGRNRSAPCAAARRSLAPLARVRGHPPVEVAGGNLGSARLSAARWGGSG
jgi:hypothetical protein